MTDRMLDFRSDTVTRPTPAMRQAMAAAEVGDDVFQDDPTVNRLQARLAEILGKEAALFVPSGTMSNQIAVRLHCRPGEEIVCESGCHIYNYEQGGAAQLSGVSTRCVTGQFGVLQLEQLQGLVRPENEHLVRTRLVALENTHNRGGGKVFPYENLLAICTWAKQEGLRSHLDGARLFNAVVASGIPAGQWAAPFDTVSICFSKGLGAPVGSALAGPKDLIAEARRIRKVFGGGMRQAGVIAAGALYALEHQVARLADDHLHAQLLADAIRDCPGLRLSPTVVETNIVIFHIAPELETGAGFVARLRERGIGALAIGRDQVRMCTHLDVSREDAIAACRVIQDVARECHQGVTCSAAQGATYAG